APEEDLVAARLEDAECRCFRRLYAFGIFIIIGECVDQLHHEIRIGPARRNEQRRLDVPGDSDIGGERLRLIDENVRPCCGETLVLCHKITRVIEGDLLRVRNRIPWIGNILVKTAGAYWQIESKSAVRCEI